MTRASHFESCGRCHQHPCVCLCPVCGSHAAHHRPLLATTDIAVRALREAADAIEASCAYTGPANQSVGLDAEEENFARGLLTAADMLRARAKAKEGST